MLRLLLFKHKVWRKPVEDSSRIQNLDVPQGGHDKYLAACSEDYLFHLLSTILLGFRSIKPGDPVENPFSLWISVNLGATLCRKKTVSQRNTEAAQGTTEKKPRFKLIGRISKRM